MKELIGTSLLIVGLYGGTKTLEKIHFYIRKAALEKSAKGLPPLPRFQKKGNRSK